MCNQKYYKTDSFLEATSLISQGFNVIDVVIYGGKEYKKYIFENSDELHTAINKYDEYDDSISTKSLMHAWSFLTSKIVIAQHSYRLRQEILLPIKKYEDD